MLHDAIKPKVRPLRDEFVAALQRSPTLFFNFPIGPVTNRDKPSVPLALFHQIMKTELDQLNGLLPAKIAIHYNHKSFPHSRGKDGDQRFGFEMPARPK